MHFLSSDPETLCRWEETSNHFNFIIKCAVFVPLEFYSKSIVKNYIHIYIYSSSYLLIGFLTTEVKEHICGVWFLSDSSVGDKNLFTPLHPLRHIQRRGWGWLHFVFWVASIDFLVKKQESSRFIAGHSVPSAFTIHTSIFLRYASNESGI